MRLMLDFVDFFVSSCWIIIIIVVNIAEIVSI